MSTPFPLPDGSTAQLRDPKLVTERQRRPITRLQRQLAGSPVMELLASKSTLSDEEFERACVEQLTPGDYELLDELSDAVIVALTESWPGMDTTSSPLDLPAPSYDALKAETAKHVTELMPSFAVTPDEASPTPPSAV